MNRIAMLAPVVAALALASCGGDDGGEQATTGAARSPATVAVRDTDLGEVIVDRRGMTLYLFEKDANGESRCYGECAQAWPPLTVSGEPKAGEGADASKLGTVERRDGSKQVTYARRPLYLFAGDAAPGDTNGHDLEQFGAEWYALTPAGEKAGAAEGGAEGTVGDDTTGAY